MGNNNIPQDAREDNINQFTSKLSINENMVQDSSFHTARDSSEHTDDSDSTRSQSPKILDSDNENKSPPTPASKLGTKMINPPHPNKNDGAKRTLSTEDSCYYNHLRYIWSKIQYNEIRRREAAEREEEILQNTTNLPQIVKDELILRRKEYSNTPDVTCSYAPSGTNLNEHEHKERLESNRKATLPIRPPNRQVIQAFRSHCTSGKFKPNSTSGSALEIMVELGDTPTSRDEIVKNHAANTWSSKMKEKHVQEVRLLRYSEMIDLLYIDHGVDLKGYFMKEMNMHVIDIGKKEDAHYKDCLIADDLSLDEIVALAEVFTLGYYKYCAGVEKVKSFCVKRIQTSKNTETGQLEFSVGTLLDQCEELRDRYRLQKSPLGNGINSLVEVNITREDQGAREGQKQSSSKKKKGRKKNKKIVKFPCSHAEIMQMHLFKLFKVLAEQIQRPSSHYRLFLSNLIDVLFEAMKVDKDVVRSLCQDDTISNILVLHERCTTFAKDMDDLTILPQVFAQEWWDEAGNILDLVLTVVGEIVLVDTSRRSSHALALYYKKVHKVMVKNITAPSTCQKMSGFACLRRVASTFPLDIVMSILYNEQVWSEIESLCIQDIQTHLNAQSWSSDDAKSRERRSYFNARERALTFINEIMKGILEPDKIGLQVQSTSEYGQIAIDLVNRGLVELILFCVKDSLSHDATINRVLELLADFTNHKICRDRLWKLKNDTLLLLEKGFTSKNINIVSTTMFFAAHLAWNSEWYITLMRMEPPIEEMCLTSMAFGMRSYCLRAYKDQFTYLLSRDELTSKVKKYRDIKNKQTKNRDDVRFLIHVEMLKEKVVSLQRWYSIEELDEHISDDIQRSLARPCLLLATCASRCDAHFRIKKCLSFSAGSLDSYNGDLYASAMSLLSMYCNTSVFSVHFPSPDDFYDPQYFLQLLIYPMKRSTTMQMDMVSKMHQPVMCKVLVSGLWKKIIRRQSKSSLEDYTTRALEGHVNINWVEN